MARHRPDILHLAMQDILAMEDIRLRTVLRRRLAIRRNMGHLHHPDILRRGTRPRTVLRLLRVQARPNQARPKVTAVRRERCKVRPRQTQLQGHEQARAPRLVSRSPHPKTTRARHNR